MHAGTFSISLYTRYSSKYRNTKNRLRELGLLDSNFTGSIFILDDWEIPREKLVLNRKLGEGAFGAVFGGEGMGLKESEVSVPVAVKTLRVGATIEDKVRVCVSSCTLRLKCKSTVGMFVLYPERCDCS